MPVVSSTHVQLLQALFDQGALSRALEREDWAAELLTHLTPVEHTTPDAWFHGLVRLVMQRGTTQRLFELLRRERPERVAEIDAVAQSFASTTTPPGAEALRVRYATLLRGQLDKLPDVFRISGGPRTVEAVYVEVTLAANEHELDCGVDAPYVKGREAARRFLEGGDDLRGRVPLTHVLSHPHRRWGLLGDPGSGKSTLLRHVAMELLGDPDGPLPIYLKVAELARGLPQAVETMCLAFHDTDLISFVLGEAQAGRATLLIDGLDEAEDLPAARRWVSGVASKVGASQIVVASRPIGYTEPAVDFRTLTLCPLAEAEQRELLTRWVKDAARAERALERLSRTPRLRRLIENPLLLTLVGVLLRKGQDVPSRRSDLYERALKLLLTREHDGEDAAPCVAMREPDLTMELLSWAALRLHGLEREAYPRDALIAALEGDPRRAAHLTKHWSSPAAFIAEVVERTGLLIPDTGRVKDARAYSFPHRTFRELLAAMALERDIVATAHSEDELSRVLTEGKARPERWAEVLALTCGRLAPHESDALVRRVTGEGSTTLLLRVVADAEGLSPETVRGALKMEAGWAEEKLRARQRLIEEIPALVGELAVAVGLLEQVARSTTCGHDLFWVREVLRRIERGEVAGSVLDGTVEDARRAAKGVADDVLGHLDPAKRVALLALLKPWWREIPAGSFEMGSDERSNEQPTHRVTFPEGFSLLGVPVTWAMYCLFDPYHTTAQDTFDARLPIEAQRDVPVYHVSWFAAVMFAEWAQSQLPLESEWEYACRAGTMTRFWSGDTEQDLARVGWYSDFGGGGNSGGHPHPVALKPANPWGLYDVHGNVWEWCSDVYDGEEYERRYRASKQSGSAYTMELSPPSSSQPNTLVSSRVLRGGSWSNEPEATRSAVRLRYPPSAVFRYLGFRLACSRLKR